jgi:prepilin-type N-terminal cleavage/methylation domain-containing protein
MRSDHDSRPLDQRGVTLIELCIALVVLAVGLLAVGQMFPAGQRSSVQSRVRTDASFFVQQKIEELSTLNWYDAALTAGRHPAGSVCDTLSAGHCLRFYNVDVLPAPLNNLKRVAVTVSWNFMGQRSLTDTTYIRL